MNETIISTLRRYSQKCDQESLIKELVGILILIFLVLVGAIIKKTAPSALHLAKKFINNRKPSLTRQTAVVDRPPDMQQLLIKNEIDKALLISEERVTREFGPGMPRVFTADDQKNTYK